MLNEEIVEEKSEFKFYRDKFKEIAKKYINYKVLISLGIQENSKELNPIIKEKMLKFFEGETGTFEKHAEDLQFMINRNYTEAWFKLDRSYFSPFGYSDTICITPNDHDKILTVYLLSER